MYIKDPARVIYPIHVWPLHYIQSWLKAAPVPMTMSRQVHIIISHLCMEVRKPPHSFSCFLYPFLDTLWCYFLMILPNMCVASRIKLHRKDNQSKALFFFSFWTTWRRGKVFYGSQVFLSVTCILNGSIFIEHQRFSVLNKNTWSVSSVLHMTVATPVI